MPCGIGVEAHRPELVDVRGGYRTNQCARDIRVGGIRATAERRPRVDALGARQPLSQTELESVEI